MKNYFEFAKSVESLFSEASNIKLGVDYNSTDLRAELSEMGITFTLHADLPEAFNSCEKKALVFAPHPDDESIIGGLPLRLMLECGFEICNVAVTLGSNKARRAGREVELKAACSYLGWGLKICGENGFENVTQKARAEDPKAWSEKVEFVAELIKSENPAIIFAPHNEDWNKSHIGTSLLVEDALALLGDSYKGLLAQTEFWRPMASANLLAELPDYILAAQMSAIARHIEEVARNPYHTRLAGWAIDNVRRGGELVGGQGQFAPDFTYGEIYNIKELRAGEYVDKFSGLFLSAKDNASKIFRS